MKQKTRRSLQNVGVIILIVLCLGWVVYEFSGYTSSTFTNNAQVYQHIVPVNSRVSGYVKEVRYNDFSQVKKGDTLIIVDDVEYRLRLAQANADLQNALAGKTVTTSGVSVIDRNVAVTEASIREIEVQLANAKRELDRYSALLEQNAVTRQQYDQVETAYKALKAKHETMQNQRVATKASSAQQSERIDQSNAGVTLAQAQVELATLNLGYTVITAPCDGYTSHRDIQPGQLVQPGQQLLTVVDVNDTWVVANYKERQLKNVEPGGKVRITVDAIPGVKFEGVITELSQATGARYSRQAPDNATGNFIKVEQRIPVKIRFTDNNDAQALAQLRSGLNVECKLIK